MPTLGPAPSNVTTSPSVLVVDDDARIRRMLARYFEGQGFVVRTAESGRAMWERLAEAPAELVLLDLVMPGEDGVAIARDLRAR